MMMTVLLVEDNFDIRNGLSLVLQSFNYKVVAVSNAVEALAVLQNSKPDVLLTDVNLGLGMNGEDLFREAQKIHPNIHVIVMTAYHSVKKAVVCMKQGVFYYMEKPMNIEDLKRVMLEIEEEKKRVASQPVSLIPQTPLSAAESLEDLERKHILSVMEQSDNLAEVAAKLGIDQSTLWRKRKALGLESKKAGRKPKSQAKLELVSQPQQEEVEELLAA